MKNKGAIIALFVFAAIAMAVYLFKDKIMSWFKPKAPDAGTGGNNSTAATNTHTETIIKYVHDPVQDVPNIVDLDKDKVLKKGSKGKEVEQLQNYINAILKAKKKTQLIPDGAFGTKTENALYFIIQKKQTTLSQFATAVIGGKWF